MTFKNELLQNFADLLVNNGFDIYIYQPSGNCPNVDFKFTKDGKIGYCSLDHFEDRVRFSTVHKPNRACGTGYGLQMPYEGLMQPTVNDAEQAFIFAPNWASWQDRKHIVKYTGIDECLQKETILKWAKYQPAIATSN